MSAECPTDIPQPDSEGEPLPSPGAVDTISADFFWMLVRRDLRLLLRPAPVAAIVLSWALCQYVLTPKYNWFLTGPVGSVPSMGAWASITLFRMACSLDLLVALVVAWIYLASARRIASATDMRVVPIAARWQVGARTIALIVFMGCLYAAIGLFSMAWSLAVMGVRQPEVDMQGIELALWLVHVVLFKPATICMGIASLSLMDRVRRKGMIPFLLIGFAFMLAMKIPGDFVGYLAALSSRYFVTHSMYGGFSLLMSHLSGSTELLLMGGVFLALFRRLLAKGREGVTIYPSSDASNASREEA